MRRQPAVVVLLLVGCSGPLVPGAGGSSGEAVPTTGTQDPPAPGPTSATSTTATTGGPSSPGSTSTTSGAMGSSGDESGRTTALSTGFIVDPDFGGGCGEFCPTDGTMASCFVCSYLDQDCGAGEVCKPVDVCDSGTWSQPVCRPALPDANGQPGEPCTIEENPFSGLDTCGPNSMCFDVDPVTLEGTCASYCELSFPCEDPTQACFDGNGGSARICLPSCSPLLEDCPLGEGCYPGTGDDFVCIPQSQPLYSDLETLHPLCPPGSFMTDEDQLGSCPEEGPCCATFCELEASECTDGLACVPFFEDLKGVDPANHSVGFCGPDPG